MNALAGLLAHAGLFIMGTTLVVSFRLTWAALMDH